MESTIYQRPREKLQERGASSLSLSELIQTILGSGSSNATGAAIARYIETLVNNDNVSLQTLKSINGVGTAKACQILAAIEVGKRVVTHE